MLVIFLLSKRNVFAVKLYFIFTGFKQLLFLFFFFSGYGEMMSDEVAENISKEKILKNMATENKILNNITHETLLQSLSEKEQ